MKSNRKSIYIERRNNRDIKKYLAKGKPHNKATRNGEGAAARWEGGCRVWSQDAKTY